MDRRSIGTYAALLAVLALLVTASSAFAQAPVPGYGGQASDVAGVTTQGGDDGNGSAQEVAGATTEGPAGSEAVAASASNGVLPFTGVDLILIAGGGLVLLGTGVALSRVVARHPA